MGNPITDSETTGEPQSFTEPEATKTFIVSVENLFRVEAINEEEAELAVAENIGEEPFVVDDTSVIEVEDE